MPPPLPAGACAAEDRPSERPTLKTLPPVDEPSSGNSNTQVIELSASALDSDHGLDSQRGVLDLEAVGFAVPRWKRWRSRAMLASGLLVVAVAAFAGGTAAFVTEHVTGVSDGLSGPAPAPREAASQHTPLVLRGEDGEAVPRAGSCATSGAPRVLAARAHLGPGLDVNALDGGFGVAFAASVDEALGVRLDGTPLRVAERMRVKAGTGVRHVTVDGARSDRGERGERDDEAIELRIDGDDARTVVPDGDAPPFRVVMASGWLQAVVAGKGKTLWPVPGSAGAKAGGVSAGAKAKADAIVGAIERADARAKAGAAKGNGGATRTSDGFVRLGGAAPVRAPAIRVASPDLRAARREDGGAVIALRAPSALWLGLVNAKLGADGPLVALSRPGALLGMPSVAPSGAGGGVVAWAERPAGDREWILMVASFGAPTGADGAREAPQLRPVGAGMSPSIAMLPDGELLLAYAIGAAGAHRVVVQRLGRDLEPRGEPVLVSPDDLNAGQPAAAAGPDGRALVAFFGAERGRPSRVLATPLACEPAL